MSYRPRMSVDGVLALLRDRGAETIDHPGGTLYAHLLRVHDRLAKHGLSTEVQLAGLAHAVYSTDGFDVALLPLESRPTVRDLVGEEAELLIYRYAACDRRLTWRALAETGQVWDRFTGTVETLGPDDLRPLVDLSIVNELDVVEHSTEIATRHADYFRTLFASWAPIASVPVIADATLVLGP
jgi:hypothetical protein